MNEKQKEAMKAMLVKLFAKIQQPVMFFDLESTGLEIVKDEILQIYVCKYDGEELIEHEEKFSIHGTISEEATGKHGFVKADLEQYDKFEERAQMIYDTYFGKDVILCGFNSNNFDIPFIIEKMLGCKIVAAASITKNKTIDVSVVYREMYPNTLEGIYKRYTGESLEGAHSADFDILATITILDRLIDADPEKDIVSSGEYLDAGRFFILDEKKIKFAKGKHKDQSVLEMDVKECISYLKWIKKTDSISQHTRIIAEKLIDKLESSILGGI